MDTNLQRDRTIEDMLERKPKPFNVKAWRKAAYELRSAVNEHRKDRFAQVMGDLNDVDEKLKNIREQYSTY